MITGLEDLEQEIGYRTGFHDATILKISYIDNSLRLDLEYIPMDQVTNEDGVPRYVQVTFHHIFSIHLDFCDWCLNELKVHEHDLIAVCTMRDLGNGAISQVRASSISFAMIPAPKSVPKLPILELHVRTANH